jgi:hypothetical protein
MMLESTCPINAPMRTVRTTYQRRGGLAAVPGGGNAPRRAFDAGTSAATSHLDWRQRNPRKPVGGRRRQFSEAKLNRFEGN